jgi:hypothetical protein
MTMVGSSLGHYRIDHLLGRGGMGEVYAAFDTRLGRRVAIKLMSPQTAADAALVERLLHEARAASALNHPNIITIHEIGQTEKQEYFFVQEFVEGETLRALISRAVPIDRVVHLMRQLAAALAAAHAAGVVHRDIKPENIMVRPDGYLKVLDFGLARNVLKSSRGEGTTTLRDSGLGTLLGTIGYMSPEQASGAVVQGESDVFSFGVVAYEVLSGRHPFAGDSILATLHAIINQHPASPCRLNRDIPPRLDALIASMLAKESRLRPSAETILRELDQIAGGAASPSPLAVVRRHSVGRQAERRAILQALEDVAAGHGVMVGVFGEPGIGKSTLVEDALGEMAVHVLRPCIARGKCSERLAGAEAYLPLLEVLDELLQPGSGGGFSDMMRTVAPTWYAHIAPPSAGSRTTDRTREDLKHASQEHMKRELAALFQEISHVRPLVLFIDDVQWADPSTIDLLNYLSGRFEHMRLLIIVACRPADLMLAHHPFLQVRSELQAREAYREVEPDFLTRADVRQYLALEFPGHRLPEELATLIHDKTEGSPLFMVDLLHYLRDRGAIVADRDSWMLARPLAEIEREVPETVKSTITRNVERLDEVDHRLASTASVQGHEFDTIVVSDVLGFDPAEVEERLSVLQRVHRLVRLTESRECPDRTLTVRYRFVHVLYQNVLYASLQPTRRRSLSAKVAASLVAHYGPNSSCIARSELAMLYEAARDFGRAAQYFLMAAQHAKTLLAFQEGVLLARRGLAALEAVPESAERMQTEMGLQVTLAACLRAVEGWAAPSVEKIYLRVRDILEQAGDTERLFPVLWGITLIQACAAIWRRGALPAWKTCVEPKPSATHCSLLPRARCWDQHCCFLGRPLRPMRF